MMGLKIRVFFFVFAGFFLVLGVSGGIFFTRDPALVLSDPSFDSIYGAQRALLRQTAVSLRLFRPVKKVEIAESAGPDAVIFAIEEASPHPWAVLAPYRYAQGLRRYAEQYQETPAIVLGGRENRREGKFLSLATDTRLNSYRAGLSAAVFVRETDGIILVFQEEQNFPVNREDFLAGLRAGDCDRDPVYMSGYTEYPAYDKLSCVVLGGNAPAFLGQNSPVPVVLFSWMDPAISPGNVKLIFDDSPWGIGIDAFRAAVGGEEPLPSEIIVPPGRIGRKDVLKDLRIAVRGRIAE